MTWVTKILEQRIIVHTLGSWPIRNKSMNWRYVVGRGANIWPLSLSAASETAKSAENAFFVLGQLCPSGRYDD